MVTHVVARAWEAFCSEKRLLVQKSFQDVGLTVPVDGSQDYKIRIKGFDRVEVGDWSQDLPVPDCYQEGQEYRVLSVLGGEQDRSNPGSEFLEFFWKCEEYRHERLVVDNVSLEPGGSFLDF